jgi:DNA-binding SARP family transcriptional activator
LGGGPTGEYATVGARLNLLGGFTLWLDSQRLDLPLHSQRLLAFLALHERSLQRTYIAGNLWGDYAEDRALANLRTALARLPRGVDRMVHRIGRQLALVDRVSVDFHETSALVRRIIDRDDTALRLHGIHRRLTIDILPDWYEDWVLAEQERYRELRLRALEALCDAFTSAQDFPAAAEAGLAAVAGEPLRESAQRALIRAYLAEGNQAAAVRQYRRFHSLLDREMGLAPSASLAELVPIITTP